MSEILHSPVRQSPILEGIRVVDLTQYLSGPTVTRLMAEMGADIVKVEQAPGGDPTRYLMVQRNGRSGYFIQQNRGKKSLCLDFSKPEGIEAIHALLAKADVLVENYSQDVLRKRGLDYASLKDRYPRLVMASISGFGRDSSHSDRPAFDLVAQAYSGILAVTGPADGPPMPIGVSLADVTSGVHATAAIGYALFHRERTGLGQHCDISMVDSFHHANEIGIQGSMLTNGKWTHQRGGEKSPLNSPQGVYRGPEGWIAIHCMDSQWPSFCRMLDEPELATDERFATLKARYQNKDVLNALIEERFAAMGTDAEVIAKLEAARVPCGPVLAPHETITHPYFVSRGMVRTVNDPYLGDITIPGNPLRFSSQTEPLDLVAPTLGQHNYDVLTEVGYSAADIDRLHAAGVLKMGER